MLRSLGYSLIARSLRRTFRRVEWVGDFTPPPADRPVVLYANHHVFHDSYLLGWLIERVLRRRTVVWMAELDRFPFFGSLGALPFPPGDAAARARTVRRTARLMRADPRTVLLYYPEGALHPAEQGVLPFDDGRCARLDRVLPDKWWWPVTLRVGGFEGATPTALLTAGAPHRLSGGRESATLEALLARLAAHASVAAPAAGDATLLEGLPGPHERWSVGARLAPAGR